MAANDPDAATVSPFPADAVILHIGPQKTGTTATQSAMHAQRNALAAHGVHYAGDTPHPRAAVAAGIGKEQRSGLSPSMKEWRKLVAEVTAATGKRVVVSSEVFADADDAAIASAVEALGKQRVHIIITVRPTTSMLPSQWQQYVRNGLTLGYDEWLHAILDDPHHPTASPTFWRRHRYDVLVDRWASVIGLDRIVVVAPDPTDPLAILRGFEGLLGLPTDTLALQDGASNRSLTYGEVEMVRQLNKEFIDRGWWDEHYNRLVRRGAVDRMRLSHTPTSAETTISTPQWAVNAASAVGADIAARLTERGVRIVGAADNLAATPSKPSLIRADGVEMGVALMAADAAAEAVMGAVINGGLAASKTAPGAKPKRKTGGKGKDSSAPPISVALSRASSKELLGAVVDRQRARLTKSKRDS